MAETTGLLNRRTGNARTAGSNPALSAVSPEPFRKTRRNVYRGSLVWRLSVWRGGRAVECTGLENQRALTGTGGSNPSPSATDGHGHPAGKGHRVRLPYPCPCRGHCTNDPNCCSRPFLYRRKRSLFVDPDAFARYGQRFTSSSGPFIPPTMTLVSQVFGGVTFHCRARQKTQYDKFNQGRQRHEFRYVRKRSEKTA